MTTTTSLIDRFTATGGTGGMSLHPLAEVLIAIGMVREDRELMRRGLAMREQWQADKANFSHGWGI